MAISKGDSRYNMIPLIVSSTAPHNVMMTVGDTLKALLEDAESAGVEVIGQTDIPLQRARHRAELKKDVAAHYKGNGEIKNKERLNRFYAETGRRQL